MKYPNSREIVSLRELVTMLHCEVDYHHNVSNFYRGYVEYAKDMFTSIKRKLARITKLIRFRE
ncbi:hypothetical protein AMTR_s00008p00261850 [Amborella trichopoda]|uniref:Uncharacterized protein n=1 Tax=Amborella trichopoda TaxID=13333 RepID=W1NJQ4_AMBTC|nr:hypothetical protein AMTR_s00008p00261850 [Amborella trichopoda]